MDLKLPDWFKLERPLCSLDLETTTVDGGQINPATDRIVELAITKILPGDRARHCYAWRMRPDVQISEAATACHGITNSDVEGIPPLADWGDDILGWLKDSDIVGFNCLRYDVPCLYEELARNGFSWDLSDVKIFDAGNIFKRKEERTLSAAVWFYLGKDHEGAHGAQADSDATLKVFLAQLNRYPDLEGVDLPRYSDFLDDPTMSRGDLHGKFLRDKDGDLVYNFGKHKGSKLRAQRGYANWMMSADFPSQTLDVIEAEFERISPKKALPKPANETDFEELLF